MSAILTVKIITDVAKAVGDLNKVEKSSSKLGSVMQKAALPAAAVGAGLTALAKEAGDSAKALQESSGAVESVFGNQSNAVQAYAKTASTSVGLATSEYQAMASVIGSQLKNMGTPTEQLAGQTDNLVKMGADLAATFGGSTSEAVAALSSLMRGEADPIERYGVSIKQADIAAQKAKMGLKGLTGEADKQATAQAMMALLTKQTSAAQGQFARESKNASGAQQIASAKAENAAATIGTALLPAYVAAAEAVSKVSEFVSQNSTVVLIAAGVIGTLAGAVLAYNAIMKAVPAIQAAVTAAQWLWNAAMTANPIGLIVAGVVLLIAGIILLWKKNEGFRTAAIAAWNAIKAAVGAAATWIVGKAKALYASITSTWSGIRSGATNAWNSVKSGFSAAGAFIKSTAASAANSVISRWTSIRNTATNAWNSVKSGFSAAGNTITAAGTNIKNRLTAALNSVRSTASGFVQPAIDGLTWLIDKARTATEAVSAVIDKAKSIGNSVKNFFTGSLPGYAGTPGLANIVSPTPATFSATWTTSPRFLPGLSSQGTAGDTNVYNFTINGAIDPASTAKQIRDLLNNDARRRGRASINGLVLA